MTFGIILLSLSIPLVFLCAAALKSYKVWRGKLDKLSRSGQLIAVCIIIAAISFGGSKTPGPTIANLKLLIAEKNGKLSSGQEFGEKAVIRSAIAMIDSAAASVGTVEVFIPAISNVVSASSLEVAECSATNRTYIRLVFPRPALTGMSNLYGEIMRCTVTNGVATAYVWFNIIPNAEPAMCFTFAAGSVTNWLETVGHTASSYPDTVAVDGYDCFTFNFPVPSAFLDGSGFLYAPLDFESRITLGCPQMGVPFNVDGGIALYYDGHYYTGVTGWRTNTTTGVSYYFSNGTLSDPPIKTMETLENEAE